MDIEALQRQLKTAIQSHQGLVAKMKAEPQNSVLQKQLRDLQSQITVLSDKQKLYVQQLRKELESTGSSGLIVSKPDGARVTGIQTIGMTPGVRYSLRPAPGGGMTLMPSGGVTTPIPATISLAPGGVAASLGNPAAAAVHAPGAPSNGMQSFAVVNPSLQSPVQNVVTLRSPTRFSAVNPPHISISGASISASAVSPVSTVAPPFPGGPVQLPKPLVISTSTPVGAQLVLNSLPCTTTSMPRVGVNVSSSNAASLPHTLVTLQNTPCPAAGNSAPSQQVAIILPKQIKTSVALSSLPVGASSVVSSSPIDGFSNVLSPSGVAASTSNRAFSPLIRVPQFNVGRPNILQSKTTLAPSSSSSSPTPLVSVAHCVATASAVATTQAIPSSAASEATEAPSAATFDAAGAAPTPDGAIPHLVHSSTPPPPPPSKIGLESPSKKKRKSPHALIRDDPLAHVEATTRFVIPHNSSAANRLDFITSTTKVPMTVLRSPSPVTASAGATSSSSSSSPPVGAAALSTTPDLGSGVADIRSVSPRSSPIGGDAGPEAIDSEDCGKIDVGAGKAERAAAASASCPAVLTRNKALLKREAAPESGASFGSQSIFPRKLDSASSSSPAVKKAKKENCEVDRRLGAAEVAGAPPEPSSSFSSPSSSSTVNREKVEFMNALDLVLPSVLKELQNKRSERKRRSTANPHFSYPGNGSNGGWGDLTSANSKRARLHQAMLAAATAAAAEEAAAAAATAAASTTESAAVAAPASPPPRTSDGDLPSERSVADSLPGGAGGGVGKGKGKTPPNSKRKSMMAGDRHRRDAEEQANESRPDTPESDVSSSSSSNNAKEGAGLQVPSPDFHEDACHTCSLSTPPLFPCTSCSLVFHPGCLQPPLRVQVPPTSDWRCHHCQPSSAAAAAATSTAVAVSAVPSTAATSIASAATSASSTTTATMATTTTTTVTTSTTTTAVTSTTIPKKVIKKKKEGKKKLTPAGKKNPPDGVAGAHGEENKETTVKSPVVTPSLSQAGTDTLENGLGDSPPASIELDEAEGKGGINNGADSNNYSATLNIMHSYIASKSSKEEEKRKLQRRNAELKAEREQLESKSHQLKLNMQAQNDQHDLLVTAHETIQGQVEKLKNFLKLFQTY